LAITLVGIRLGLIVDDIGKASSVMRKRGGEPPLSPASGAQRMRRGVKGGGRSYMVMRRRSTKLLIVSKGAAT